MGGGMPDMLSGALYAKDDAYYRATGFGVPVANPSLHMGRNHPFGPPPEVPAASLARNRGQLMKEMGKDDEKAAGDSDGKDGMALMNSFGGNNMGNSYYGMNNGVSNFDFMNRNNFGGMSGFGQGRGGLNNLDFDSFVQDRAAMGMGGSKFGNVGSGSNRMSAYEEEYQRMMLAKMGGQGGEDARYNGTTCAGSVRFYDCCNLIFNSHSLQNSFFFSS
jgi:hypothetical protein